MTPFGKPATAPNGAVFFDCDFPLTPRAMSAFRVNGFSGVARYLSRLDGDSSHDLGAIEARAILSAGLALVPVQHVAPPGWHPTAALGTAYGRDAAINAADCGCPAGVCVWLDLESVSPGATVEDVIAYCEAWFAEITRAMFVPGLYVGVGAVLDAAELYRELSVEHYWHAGSRSAPIPAVRGVQIVQTISRDTLAGVGYDVDRVQVDQLGGLPLWWVA